MNAKDELKSLSEILSSIKKDGAYTVPDGYFSQLSQEIREKISISADEKNDIPKGYFNTLPDIVLKKAKENHQVKVRRLPSLLKYSGIAASLLLLVFVGNIFLSNDVSSTETQSIDMMFLEHLSNQPDEVETATLLQMGILEEDFNIYQSHITDDIELYEYYLESNIDEIDLAYLDEIIK
jgi:hypothetical protein